MAHRFRYAYGQHRPPGKAGGFHRAVGRHNDAGGFGNLVGGEKVFGAVGSVGFHLNPHAKLPRGLFQRFGSHIGVGHPHRAGCHCQHQRAGGRGFGGRTLGGGVRFVFALHRIQKFLRRLGGQQ